MPKVCNSYKCAIIWNGGRSFIYNSEFDIEWKNSKKMQIYPDVRINCNFHYKLINIIGFKLKLRELIVNHTFDYSCICYISTA